jgi:hypothetical protein
MIGIAKKEIELTAHPLESGKFWGYIPLQARKFDNEGHVEDFG